MLRRLLFLLSMMVGLIEIEHDLAQTNEAPQKVQELLRLLDDPVIRDWVAAQKAPAATPMPVADEMTPTSYMDQRLIDIRRHISNLIAAVPNLPGEFARARDILMVEFEDRGIGQIVSLIIGFLALGFLIEWLFRYATRHLQRWIITVPLNTVSDRLRAAGIRLCFGMGLVIAFAVGSVGAFLAFAPMGVAAAVVLAFLKLPALHKTGSEAAAVAPARSLPEIVMNRPGSGIAASVLPWGGWPSAG